jgi:putative membrane-bound dehydrogenase-like protein
MTRPVLKTSRHRSHGSYRTYLSRSILAAALALCTPVFAANNSEAKPRTPDEALQSFEAAPGLKVELVAAEPLVASPCALAFDEQGRLFVAENRGYPTGPKEGEPGAGKIALLQDTDGDGRMDKRVDFAEGLGFPNGLLPWKGGLIVTASPDILFLQDTDGDGRADVRRVLLTGFDTAKSTQLRVNRPMLGPDGWIYFASGLSGGTVTSPEHPEMPPLKMTADIRWNPLTGEYQSVDGKSQFGQSFDDFGRRFICMNRVQVQHVVLPSRYLKRNPLLPFSESVQNCPEAVPNPFMRSTGGAARLYPISTNITTADSHGGTFSAACAVTIWRGGALPEEYLGAALSCDPTGNLVHVDKLVPKGATFAAVPLLEKRELLAFKDDWARPIFLESGPDGALYVCDMYRRVIEHPDYLSKELRQHTDFESGKLMGRIWRVTGGAPRPRATLPVAPDPALVATANGWLAQTAFRLIAEQRDSAAVAGLQAASRAGQGTPAGRVALLDLLSIHGALAEQDIEAAFASKDPRLAERALVLSEGNPAWQAKARKHLDNLMADGRVRFQAVLSAAGFELPGLAEIFRLADGDRWTEAAVLSALPKQTLPLLKQLPSSFTSPSLHMAGRLIGAGKECADAGSLVEQLGNLQEGLPLVLTGFCEASRAKLDPTHPVLGPLLRKAQAQLQEPETATPPLNAVSLLSYSPWAFAKEPLTRAATQRASAELQQAAIRALAGYDQPEVAPTLLQKARWTAASPAERETILAALLARPAHYAGVLTAIEDGEIPASAVPTLRRAVFSKSKDAAIRERAEKLFTAAAGDRQKVFEAAKESLALAAKPEHGRELFRAICATCHRLYQEGFAVGPDLFDIRNQPKENVLFHIIIPDAEIAPAFTTYTVETKDGRTLAGLLGSETASSVTLRMPLAQEETILRSNIANLTAMPNSLMPTGLDAALTKQDLADLLAFLKGER